MVGLVLHLFLPHGAALGDLGVLGAVASLSHQNATAGLRSSDFSVSNSLWVSYLHTLEPDLLGWSRINQNVLIPSLRNLRCYFPRQPRPRRKLEVPVSALLPPRPPRPAPPCPAEPPTLPTLPTVPTLPTLPTLHQTNKTSEAPPACLVKMPKSPLHLSNTGTAPWGLQKLQPKAKNPKP